MKIKLIVDDEVVYDGDERSMLLWNKLYDIRKHIIFSQHDMDLPRLTRNIKRYCDFKGVDYDKLMNGKCREQPYPYIKMIIANVMRFEYAFETTYIARLFNVDHSTVIHHLKSYNDQKGIYEEMHQDYFTAHYYLTNTDE